MEKVFIRPGCRALVEKLTVGRRKRQDGPGIAELWLGLGG